MGRPLFQLSPRLALCAGLVREHKALADIGTDHAYLPIWLLKQGKLSRALAADINPGPLESAKRNAQRYEVGNSLTLRLSDGLREIVPGEAEDVVIAGMGGELILRMISETPWLKDPEKRLVLQPMSSVPELRTGLAELGFQILEEQAVADSGKIYSAFSAGYIGETPEADRIYPYLGRLKPAPGAVLLYAEKVVRELSNEIKGAAHTGDEMREQELRSLRETVQEQFLRPYERGL